MPFATVLTMRLMTMAVAALLLLPSPCVAYFRLNAQVVQQGSENTTVLEELRRAVLALVNAERVNRKLKPLKVNGILQTAAQKHAEDMHKRKYFSHVSPDKRKPEDRIRELGYYKAPCEQCKTQYTSGENIAKGQKTAKEVMASWMKSPKHKANILAPHYRDFGLGYKNGIWVQVFGSVLVVK